MASYQSYHIQHTTFYWIVELFIRDHNVKFSKESLVKVDQWLIVKLEALFRVVSGDRDREDEIMIYMI